MKKFVLVLLATLASLPLWAQTTATTGTADLQAERDRLASERAAIDARFTSESQACYKKFAVEDCLKESRTKRRTDTDNIKRQESALNDIERKRRATAELQKLDQKKETPRLQDTPDKQEQSRQAQQDREQRNADHAQSRADFAAQEEDRKRQLAEKARAHADEQAKAAQLRAQAPANVQRFEEKQKRAQEHRTSRDRQNVDRKKPRGAPLPVPGASAPASAASSPKP